MPSMKTQHNRVESDERQDICGNRLSAPCAVIIMLIAASLLRGGERIFSLPEASYLGNPSRRHEHRG